MEFFNVIGTSGLFGRLGGGKKKIVDEQIKVFGKDAVGHRFQ